jgi:hypothetical protein
VTKSQVRSRDRHRQHSQRLATAIRIRILQILNAMTVAFLVQDHCNNNILHLQPHQSPNSTSLLFKCSSTTLLLTLLASHLPLTALARATVNLLLILLYLLLLNNVVHQHLG